MGHFKQIGGNFSLTDQAGKVNSLADLKGKVVVLFFGYTMCPDVCPTTLTEMTLVRRKLGRDAKDVRFLMVTLDPERDSNEQLKNYLAFFHSDFIGWQGKAEEVKKAADLFKVSYRKTKLDSATHYAIDHTARSYLIDKSGELRGLIPFQTSAKETVQAIRKLVFE